MVYYSPPLILTQVIRSYTRILLTGRNVCFLDGRDSIEILSEEEGDGRPRPPLRQWRIKKERVEMADTCDDTESYRPPSLQIYQIPIQSTEHSETHRGQVHVEADVRLAEAGHPAGPHLLGHPGLQLGPDVLLGHPGQVEAEDDDGDLDRKTGPGPLFVSNVLGEGRKFESTGNAQRNAEEEIISLSSDEAPEEEELPIIQLQQVPSDPPDAASSNLILLASGIAASGPGHLSQVGSEAEATLHTSHLSSPGRSGSSIMGQRERTVDETNDSIDYGPPSRRPQEIVITDSDGSVTETLETCPNRTVMISEDEDNYRAGNSCAEDKDKSDSENSYVALVRDERGDFKEEDDDIEELLRNSPTDVVTLSDTEHDATAAPPPAPTDLDMRAALFGDRRRSQSRGRDRRSRSRSGEAPLFVIGAPRTVREESESDEDVRIVPGRKERSDEEKKCIQID